MKNNAAKPHSNNEAKIKISSLFKVRSLKKSPCLNLVVKNKSGKYKPPPISQGQYPFKCGPRSNQKIKPSETQQYSDSPANKNKAILDNA